MRFAADRRHELAREALGGGVDGALAPAAARLGDDRAREVGLAEPLLGDEEERVQALLPILCQREATPRARGRCRPRRRRCRRCTAARAAPAWPRAIGPGADCGAAGRGAGASARSRGPRRGPRRSGARDRERDAQLAPGLLGEQARDPREEALANRAPCGTASGTTGAGRRPRPRAPAGAARPPARTPADRCRDGAERRPTTHAGRSCVFSEMQDFSGALEPNPHPSNPEARRVDHARRASAIPIASDRGRPPLHTAVTRDRLGSATKNRGFVAGSRFDSGDFAASLEARPRVPRGIRSGRGRPFRISLFQRFSRDINFVRCFSPRPLRQWIASEAALARWLRAIAWKLRIETRRS